MWWTADDQEFAKWYNALKYSTVADLISSLPFPEETHSPLKDVENSHTSYEAEKYRWAIGKLLQAIRKIYNYFNGGGMQLVDRGDSAGYDFTLSNFTTDGNWHDLDLSAIVPDGVRAVILGVNFTTEPAGSFMMFRKKGNVNEFNVGITRIENSNNENNSEPLIFLDTSRKIQYKTSNLTFEEIKIIVKGWFT
jgi:hypothetical protein